MPPKNIRLALTDAIQFYISKGKISQNHLTAWFLEIIHKWYNIMSSRSGKLDLSKNNMVEETLKFLKDMLHVTLNIKIGQKGHWIGSHFK